MAPPLDFADEGPTARRPHLIAPTLASAHAVLISERMGDPLPGGSDAGLAVTVNANARVLRRAGVHAETWKVKNADELMARISSVMPGAARPITHVVINNPRFILPISYAEMAGKWPDIEFVQLNHSGQSYLSIDHHGIQNIRGVADLETALHNVRVAGNNPRFRHWLNDDYGISSLLLPNLYDVETFRNPVTVRRCPDPLRIGSFGAGRYHKNQLVAAQGAIGLARRLGANLELYVNSGHWDTTGPLDQSRAELFAGLPNARLIPVPWAAWPRFRRTVASMDLMMSPSFDETFCVICADGIAEGVPSVVGPALEWTPRSWQAEPHDPASVARVGLGLLHDVAGAVHDGRAALKAYVAAGTRLWLDYLTGSP
jgi:hypothetical protein